MNNYLLALTDEGNMFLMNSQDEIPEYCVGVASSSWKKILTPSQRRHYHNVPPSSLQTPMTLALTYPDGAVVITNPYDGDYIPPGFAYASPGIEGMISRYGNEKVKTRAEFVPIDPNGLLLFPSLTCRGDNTIRVNRYSSNYSGYASPHIPGWKIKAVPQSSNYNTPVDIGDNGVSVGEGQEYGCIASQTIYKATLARFESIHLRIPNALAVFLGDLPFERQGDDTWLLSEVPKGKFDLCIGFGQMPISAVEVIND